MDENNNSEQGRGPRGTREQTRSRWRTLIDEQATSGLEAAEFCRQRSIATSSFYCWRRKLARPPQPAQGRFVPVKLAEGPEGLSGALEVRLSNGREGRVRGRFDREVLVELIAVLEGLA